MIEKKKKKSRAIIISIIAMIILAFSIFLIFKNKDKLFPEKEIAQRVGIFDSLFGTSKSKSLEIVDSLRSNQNPTQINAQAGEDIKRGDLLRLVGYDPNGNPIVISIKNTSEIKDYSDIFGIAAGDINYGNIGNIIIPDMSEYRNIWDRVGDLGSWIYDNTIGSLIDLSLLNRDPNNQGIDLPVPPVIQPASFPKITVTASPTNINQGETSTITWVSENSTTCNIGNGFVENTSGSFPTVPLNNSQSFSVSCKGDGGMTSGNVFVLVNNDTNTIFPKITVTASPTNINQGETSTITWVSENSTTCNIGNGFVENTSGSFPTGPLNNSKSFSVSCKGDGGTAPGNVFVIVKTDQNMPIIEYLKAEPVEVDPDGYSVISWSSVNTNSCVVNGLNIECKKDGKNINCGRYKRDNNKTSFECKKDGQIINCNDIESITTFGTKGEVRVGPLTRNSTFSVVCSNENSSASDFVFVRVKNDNNLNYPKIKLTANPTNVKYGGSSLLEWETENITSGKIKISNQDFLYNSECKIDGSVVPCDEVKNLECENNLENESCQKLECTQNKEIIDCKNLYEIPLNGKLSITDIRQNTSITATYIGEKNSTSRTVYIFVEQVGQCEDGIDNDKDGLIDKEDPGCYEDFDISDASKYNPKLFEGRVTWIPQCRDGIDNETLLGLPADGADRDDPDCYDKNGKYDPDILFEFGGIKIPQCSDGRDNDRDGLTDKNDPQCHRGGTLDGEYLPWWESESEAPPLLLPQCSDKIDNDGDGFIDQDDPQCHRGGTLDGEYLPEHDSESSNPLDDEDNKKNFCADFEQTPIEFNDDEKRELEHLLGQFYLIASTLRTNDNITSIYNEIAQQKKFIEDIQGLTSECNTETRTAQGEINSRLVKDGVLMKTHGNPWYSPQNGGTFPYTNTNEGYSVINWLQNNDYKITGVGYDGTGNDGDNKNSCEVISGYYYGTASRPIAKNTENSAGPFVYSTGSNLILESGGDCTELNGKKIDDYITINYLYNEGCGADPLTYLKDPYLEELSYRKAILSAGCKWKDGVDIKKAEQLLKIW